MNRTMTVLIAGLLMAGCTFHPEEMSTPVLCDLWGNFEASGHYQEVYKIKQELMKREGDFDSCQMLRYNGAARYQQGQAVSNWGKSLMEVN